MVRTVCGFAANASRLFSVVYSALLYSRQHLGERATVTSLPRDALVRRMYYFRLEMSIESSKELLRHRLYPICRMALNFWLPRFRYRCAHMRSVRFSVLSSFLVLAILWSGVRGL